MDWMGHDDSGRFGVESLALDPSDPDRLYLAVGTYLHERGQDGVILRSTDRGATFQRAPLPFKFGGNEQGRGNGERLAVEFICPPALNSALVPSFLLQPLIENAIKYGSPAGATVTLALSRESGPRGPVLRVDVVDQGAGIDARHIPRLTERFYRVDSHRSREKGGTGLGLAIVKHIVQRHRGRMRIESERGKGSVFSVIFPET